MTAIAAPRPPVELIPMQQPVQAGMRCAVQYTGHIWRLALVMQVFPQGRVAVRKYIDAAGIWRPKNSVLSLRELGQVTMLPAWAQEMPIPQPVLREVVPSTSGPDSSYQIIEGAPGEVTLVFDGQTFGPFRRGPRNKELQIRLPRMPSWLPARGHIGMIPREIREHLAGMLGTKGLL